MAGMTMTGTMSPELLEVMERAKRDPQVKLRGLARFIDEAALRRAFDALRRDAAVGVDGMLLLGLFHRQFPDLFRDELNSTSHVIHSGEECGKVEERGKRSGSMAVATASHGGATWVAFIVAM